MNQKVTFKSAPDGKTPLPDELTNIREITQDEVARGMLFTYTPISFGTVNVADLPGRSHTFGGRMVKCFHFHDGTGVLVDRDYYPSGKLYFYAYGCKHQYAEVSRPAGNRSGLHHDRCVKCGHDYHYDTSD